MEDKIEYVTTSTNTTSMSISFIKLTIAQMSDIKNRFGVSKSMVVRQAVQELFDRLSEPGATFEIREK